MASRVGRKRKVNVKRTPSGAISRAGQDPRVTVLQQRHRKGSLSQARSSAAGRLVNDDTHLTRGASRDALHRAAERLAEAYAAYQAALASRRPMSVTSGGSSAPEDQERSIRAVKIFTDANTVLVRAGAPVRAATLSLCCDHHEEDWSPPFWLAFHAVEGLKLLADHFGIEWRGEDRPNSSSSSIAA